MTPRAVSLEQKSEGHGLLRKRAKGHFVCDKEEETRSQSQDLGSREIFMSISGAGVPHFQITVRILCFIYR